MRRKFSILSTFLFAIFLSHARVNTEGIVITQSDTIRGTIRVDLERNIVSVKSESRYFNLVASQIKKVVLKESDGDRGYFSGVFGADGKHLLFTILSEGRITLLYRENVKFSEFDEEVFPPYFVAKENSIFSVGTKKEFLAQLADRSAEMKDFVKVNKTDFSSKESIAQLFHFYNGVEDASQMFTFED